MKPSCTGSSSLGVAEPLDGGDLVAVGLDGEHRAALHRRAVDSTVQAPQLVVSQPVWVPVSRSPWRSRWASSSRGSTSAVRCAPLTVIVTRRTGTPSRGRARRSPRRGWSCQAASRRRVDDPGQDPGDEGVHDVPLVRRRCRGGPCAAGRPRRPGRRPGLIAACVERPARRARRRPRAASMVRAADAGERDARAGRPGRRRAPSATATPAVAKSPTRRSSLR